MFDIDNIYKTALESAPVGYGYFKIILDNKGNPCDFNIIELNSTFEEYTGLSKENDTGKIFSSVNKEFDKEELEYLLSIFGDVAVNGVVREFELFSKIKKKWYNIKVISPKKYFFITYLTNISIENELIHTAEKLLHYSTDDIDYKKITQTLIDISGAKIGVFNFIDVENKTFETKAIIGIKEAIKEAEKKFGFAISGKKWMLDPRENREVGRNIITCYNSLRDFMSLVAPEGQKKETERISKETEDNYGIKETVVVKIIKDDNIIGNFILLMPEGMQLNNPEIVKLYARQTALLLKHKQEEDLLKDKKQQYKVLFESTLSGIILIDGETFTISLANDTVFKMLGFDNQNEIIGKNPIDFVYPEDREAVTQMMTTDLFVNDERKPEEYRVLRKDGSFIWISSYGAKINFDGKPSGLVSFYDITERKTAEKALFDKNKHLSLLNEYSMKLSSASVNEDIYSIAANTIKQLTNAIDATISYYDEKNNELVISYNTLSNEENNKIKKVIGRELKGFRTKLNEKHYNAIVEEGITYKNSVSEATFGSVPPSIGNILKRTFNINWLGGIALMHKNKLVGTVVFVGGKKSKKVDNEILKTFGGITANAIQRWMAEKSLIESEEKFRNLAEKSPLAIMIYQENRFVYTNQMAENLTGYSKEELYSKNYWDIVHPDYKEMIKQRGQERQYGNLNIGFYEIIALRKDGKEIWVTLTGTKILYNDKPAGLASVIDITERKNAERLKQEVELAKRSVNFKQNFLANMSHEIRTPLTGIMGMTEFLSKTKLDVQQQDYLNTIKQSTENLREIINLILDYSKIEAGKIKLNNVDFSLSSLFDETEKYFKSICRKDIVFEKSICPEIPEYINTDKNRVNQIISNLILNAVKYTENGKISLNATLLDNSPKTKSSQVTIKIEVTDTGIGIEPEQTKHLFQPFTQIEKKDTRMHDGTGLGLSICKELVNLLEGNIGVNSVPAEGSCFWFTFKAKVSKGEILENTIATANENNKKIKSFNILLAEDKKVTQKVVSLLLESEGHNVSIAENGKKALEMFDKNKFDIILMDIQMPEMDGITATKKLKEKYKNIPPIIGLSANAFEGDREKYMKQGMDEYLTKPLKTEDFREVLTKLKLC